MRACFFHLVCITAAAPAAAAAALPARALAQTTAHSSVLRALAVDAGVLASHTAPATAAFGASLDLAPSRLPGLLRIGITGWIADTAHGGTMRGRDLALLWLFRSSPAGDAGWRLFAGAGPALAALDEGGISRAPPVRLAAAAQTGLELPLDPREALALELRLGTVLPVHRPAQLSLRLALRLAPGELHGLGKGEPNPPLAAQPAAPVPLPPPELDPVLTVAAGVLGPAHSGGGLRLKAAAFEKDGVTLTRQAVIRLARAGWTLHRLGADPLRVVIYTASPARVVARQATLRAVAIALALARGGYPVQRMELEVAAAPSGEEGVGQIIAGSRCVTDCVAPTRRPRQ